MIEPADNVDAHEQDNEDRCITAAIAHGLLEQGIDPLDCDDGEHRCPLCPWSNASQCELRIEP